MPHVAASCFIMIPTPRREEFKEETAFLVRMGYGCISIEQAFGNQTECIDPRPVVFFFFSTLQLIDPSTNSYYVNYSASSSLEPPYTLLSFPFTP